MCLYSKLEHIEKVITRCENHKKTREFEKPTDVISEMNSCNNDNNLDSSHLIRCGHLQSIYEINPVYSHRSVVVPLDRPSVDKDSTTLFYKFMCFSSCVGGSKMPFSLVLTLESNGQIIGRDSIEVKVCASPLRDRTLDEKKIIKKLTPLTTTPTTVKTNKKRKINDINLQELKEEPLMKQKKLECSQTLLIKENVNENENGKKDSKLSILARTSSEQDDTVYNLKVTFSF
jgi:hypothetical protein